MAAINRVVNLHAPTRRRTGPPQTKEARASIIPGFTANPLTGLPAWLESAYCFSLSAQVDQQFVGLLPGGYRIDLNYSPSPNSVLSAHPEVLGGVIQKYLGKGRLLSGSDWVFVSEDGIVDFDSRITLKLDTSSLTDPPKEDCVIGGRLRGRANLRDCLKKDGTPLFGPEDDQQAALRSWKDGFADGSFLPLVLAATFDVPIAGFDDAQTEVYDQFRDIGRSLLLGAGRSTFKQNDYGAVTSIELHLYTVKARSIGP